MDLNIDDLSLFYEDNMLKLKCDSEEKGNKCDQVIWATLIDLDFVTYTA